MENYVRKNGLVYNSDLHVLLAVDTDSNLFNGRVPFGVHEITDELFSDCPYTSISLPDSVTKLGNCIFENSTRLERIKMPAQITSLPPYLFSGCTALTKVIMPNTVEAFPEGLFYNCSSITEIPFRAGIKSLPENVFAGCTSISSIVIPDTVTSIGANAFGGCTALESVVLPASLETMDPSAFSQCEKLRFIRISDDNLRFFTENGNLYEKTADGNRLLIDVKGSGVSGSGSSLLKNDEPDEVNEMGLWVNIEDEEDDDTDDIFSSEVGATEEEAVINEPEIAEPAQPEQIAEPVAEVAEAAEPVAEAAAQKSAPQVSDNLLSSIMNQNTEAETPSQDVSVSENELESLSNTMEVMNAGESFSENARGADDVSVKMDELEKLFASEEPAPEEDPVDKNFEKNIRILCESVTYSCIETFEPDGKSATLPDLFVIAETLSADAQGKPCASQKLQGCCKKLAHFHDLKRVIYISGLDLENEEFLQFCNNLLHNQNILLACYAPSSASLSDYSKKICALTGISLAKEDILEQRRKASIKNPSLIKLIIQDKMD